MTRPEITAKLSAMVENKINPHNDPRIYWAREVTFDYYTDLFSYAARCICKNISGNSVFCRGLHTRRK